MAQKSRPESQVDCGCTTGQGGERKPCDHRSVGGGVSELRFHAGKGPRIYYTNQGETIILLLVGGDKSSQDDDLKAAKKIVKDMRR